MSESTSIVPSHVGIIMDGNRRWARERGLPTLEGHAKGYEKAMEITEHAFHRGVRHLTLFAFSTENWNRAANEVRYLMGLLLKMISEETRRLHEKGVCLRVIGGREHLSDKIIAAIDRAQELTRRNTRASLAVALNYGGRPELVRAVQSIVAQGLPPDHIDEKAVSDHLYTAGMPDPDLIIRTSGEERLSGFLLWQSAYSELYFTRTYWPDFTKEDFDAAIEAYSGRKRRFGK